MSPASAVLLERLLPLDEELLLGNIAAGYPMQIIATDSVVPSQKVTIGTSTY